MRPTQYSECVAPDVRRGLLDRADVRRLGLANLHTTAVVVMALDEDQR
jgi:hypothetical protein